MNTDEFLYHRRFGPLEPEHVYAWGERLVLGGHESDAVLRLLGEPDMHWEMRSLLIETVFAELGIDPNVDERRFFNIRERILIADYLNGKMDARTLIRTAYKELTLSSDYDAEFVLWFHVEEDLCLIDDGIGPVFSDLDPNDLDGSLRRILEQVGKLPLPEDW